MSHRTTARFWACCRELPEGTKRVAHRAFALLKEHPSHPSLRFKKVGKFWSVRVGRHYRALAIQNGPELIWVWLGCHEEYERIIKDQG